MELRRLELVMTHEEIVTADTRVVSKAALDLVLCVWPRPVLVAAFEMQPTRAHKTITHPSNDDMELEMGDSESTIAGRADPGERIQDPGRWSGHTSILVFQIESCALIGHAAHVAHCESSTPRLLLGIAGRAAQERIG